MRNKFDEQLEELNNMLTEMGAMAEKAIDCVNKALNEQKAELAHEAIAIEAEIDQHERDIEALCMKLLLQQQPVAKDLRLISASLKMITDMERIGDQARDISEIILLLIEKNFINELDHIPQMAEATMKMVSGSVRAFVNKNLELAQYVMKYDDVVDDLFTEVREDIIEMLRGDSTDGEHAVDLLMIAKYFERIGDHAVNISEWVEYAITGNHPKY